jgi:hypothetical protein
MTWCWQYHEGEHMPHVIATSDSIHEVFTPHTDETLRAPLAAPSVRRPGSLLAYLYRLFLPARQSSACRRVPRSLTTRDFERPIDTLARTQPYIFIKSMSG